MVQVLATPTLKCEEVEIEEAKALFPNYELSFIETVDLDTSKVNTTFHNFKADFNQELALTINSWLSVPHSMALFTMVVLPDGNMEVAEVYSV